MAKQRGGSRLGWIIGILGFLGIVAGILVVLWKLGYIFKTEKCAPVFPVEGYVAYGTLSGSNLSFDIGFNVYSPCPMPTMQNTALNLKLQYSGISASSPFITSVDGSTSDWGIKGEIQNVSGISPGDENRIPATISVNGVESAVFPIIVR